MPTRHEIDIIARNKTKQTLGTIQSDLGKLSKGFGTVTKAASGFIAALAIREVAEFGKEMINITSTFQTYRNQLRLITDGQEDLERVFGLLVVAAKENRTAFGETVDLFTKLRVTTEALGVSEERVINVTGKLSKALQLAGADGNTASSVIRQFGQAMASGEVRGDEFRSLVEGLGPALAIMAQESGITVGELRKMSRAGELTAEAMFELLENSTALENAFQSQQPTISQLETALGDAFDRAIVAVTEATGLAAGYDTVVKGLTETFDRMAGIEDPFKAMELKDLEKIAESDSIQQVALALEELRDRYNDYLDMGPLDLIFNFSDAMGLLTGETHEQSRAVKDLIAVLEEREQVLIRQAETDKELAEAYAAELAAIRAILKPYQSFIDLADKYAKIETGDRVDKLNKKLQETETVLLNLELAQSELNLSEDQHSSLLDLNQQAYNKLGEQINETIRIRDDYKRQIKEIEDAEEERRKKEELAEFERQQRELQKQRDEQARFKEKWTSRYETITDGLRTEQQALEDGYQDQLFTLEVMLKNQFIEKQEYYRIAEQLEKRHQSALSKIIAQEAEKRRIAEYRAKGLSEQQAEDLNEQVKLYEKDKGEFIIKNTGDILENLGKVNKQAFMAYKAYAIAEAIVSTAKGAAAAIGSGMPPPFNFIAAAATVAAGMAQVAAIRAQTYGGRRIGGPVTGGSPYIIGEAGPEIFTPKTNGNITPMDQLNGQEPVQVVFQIQANDTRGFDDLIKQRRGLIVNMINDAVMNKGKEALI